METPVSCPSTKVKLSARVQPKVRRSGATERQGEQDIDQMLNNSDIVLTNLSEKRGRQPGMLPHHTQGPEILFNLDLSSMKESESNQNYGHPQAAKQAKRGARRKKEWKNPRVLSKAILVIEINDKVDRGVGQININSESNFNNKKYLSPRNSDFFQKSESQSGLPDDYLENLLKSEKAKDISTYSKQSPKSALEKDLNYQLFSVNLPG